MLFSPDYLTARDRFREMVAIVGGCMETLSLDAQGPNGESLGIDIAWFGTANEHSDWETAHHAFTYCNALHQLLERITAEYPAELESPELLRGVIHGAMRLYLIRFLNVPPARLPGEAGDRLAGWDGLLTHDPFASSRSVSGSEDRVSRKRTRATTRIGT